MSTALTKAVWAREAEEMRIWPDIMHAQLSTPVTPGLPCREDEDDPLSKYMRSSARP